MLRFHRVDFEIGTSNVSSSHLSVWVSQACHYSQIERVARELLSMELARISREVIAGEPPLSEESIAGLRGNKRDGVHRRKQRLSRVSEAQLHTGFRISRYVLHERRARPCSDLAEWKTYMQSGERWVSDTTLEDADRCQVRVCTVFLGLDMSLGVSEPVLFETIILGGRRDRDLFRYRTWAEAESGHEAAVRFVQQGYATSIPGEMKAALELTRKTLSIARRLERSDIFSTSR